MFLPILKFSVFSFTTTAFIALLLILPVINEGAQFVVDYCVYIIIIHYLLINLNLKLFLNDNYYYQVAIRSSFLGIVFASGIYIAILSPASWKSFGCYICYLSFFHYSEFFMTALINPQTLSLDSFLLNHSKEYGVAAAASWLEFFIERWFIPELKQLWIISVFGAVMCTAGEILRKLAMLTARSNFNHIVQSVRNDNHVLVTHGVYSIFRHPSYVGWFYWSIGTQLLLLNPLCLVAYTLASWRFFYDRILIEELTLISFFGEQYYEYQRNVRTGLPFIEGYRGAV